MIAAVVACAIALPQDPAMGRAIVEEMNRVRTNPAGYVATLEQLLPLFVGNQMQRPGEIALVTNEGPAAVREAIQALRSQAPLPALSYADGLALAAADHVRDQGPFGRTGHDGSDGSTMSSRINRYGRWSGSASENIDYGGATARDVIISLIVDDGVASRGHRRNILDPGIRVAGAACGPHQRYRVMCVIDHAAGFTPNGAPPAAVPAVTPATASPSAPAAKPPRAPPSGLPRPR